MKQGNVNGWEYFLIFRRLDTFFKKRSGILATKSSFFSLSCWPLSSPVWNSNLRFISNVNKEILCSINRERRYHSTPFFHTWRWLMMQCRHRQSQLKGHSKWCLNSKSKHSQTFKLVLPQRSRNFKDFHPKKIDKITENRKNRLKTPSNQEKKMSFDIKAIYQFTHNKVL